MISTITLFLTFFTDDCAIYHTFTNKKNLSYSFKMASQVSKTGATSSKFDLVGDSKTVWISRWMYELWINEVAGTALILFHI